MVPHHTLLHQLLHHTFHILMVLRPIVCDLGDQEKSVFALHGSKEIVDVLVEFE